jgi:hypothetical protein
MSKMRQLFEIDVFLSFHQFHRKIITTMEGPGVTLMLLLS